MVEIEVNEAKAIIRIVKFAKKKGIETIIVGGLSAQSAAILFKEAWQILYPKEKMPKFYALGGTPRILTSGNRTNFEEVTKRRMPSLFDRVDKPTLILEEYALRGVAITHLKKFFTEHGFGKLYTSVMFSKESARRANIIGSYVLGAPDIYGHRRSITDDLPRLRQYRLKLRENIQNFTQHKKISVGR